jgi:ubiquinone/menaquinone biosynthesis C-methylase UbiE
LGGVILLSHFNWVDESEKQWNQNSNYWYKNSKDMWEKGSRKDILPFFQEFVLKGAKVCDLGCGDGYASFKLAKSGYQVLGIDLSEEMIEKARQQRKEQHLVFKKSDISHVEEPDASFEAVLAINSLEWTEQPLKVLDEMKRLVKPSGYACVGILGPTAMPRTNSYRRLYGEPVICNTIMPWEFERLANENGWEKVADLPVYKRGVDGINVESLSIELKQALTFMWVFMLKRREV